MIKRLIRTIINKMRIKLVVDYIIKEGTSHTTNGQRYIYFNDISEVFPWATSDWISEGMDIICKHIDRRKEILSSTWIGFNEEGIADSFDCNYCGKYCPNYEEE